MMLLRNEQTTKWLMMIAFAERNEQTAEWRMMFRNYGTGSGRPRNGWSVSGHV